MKIVEVRNVKIGEGIPKICVPIVAKSREGILREAENIRELPADVAEWRADWYEEAKNPASVLAVADDLREVLCDKPLLFTFRTAKEGGEQEISAAAYETLNLAVIESGLPDMVDVEAFMETAVATKLIAAAHHKQVKVIASNHDFFGTPDKEEIIKRLVFMQELHADIVKIAVMPKTKQDVCTLLEATAEMNEKYADRPVITMSMAKDGVISRLCGEIFGSALTFGAAEKSSAPGQLEVNDLKQILQILHKNIVK